MKPLFLLATMALATAPGQLQAQADTSHHRAVYKQINDSADSLTKVSATVKKEGKTYDLTGWLEDGRVRKIVVQPGNTGNGEDEYYLENEESLFIFSTYRALDDAGNPTNKVVRERIYFADGAIFKWLSDDKSGPVLHAEDYQSGGNAFTADSATFVAALKAKSKGSAKTATRTTEGKFTAITWGDYPHWTMKTNGGEVSLFILKPDPSVSEVINDPDSFIGRKCRVTWKKSREHIPEAGGEQDIEQILSVEWLGRK
ncbi:MAG: hypothetical protein ACOYNN_13065 [Terrimicrobiaceae bacterium]